MSATTRILGLATLVLAIASSAACDAVGQAPAPTVCDGVSSEAGGCDAGRHLFVADTCADLAREWAGALDRAVVAVLDGPPDVGQQGRGVRMKQAMVITSVDLNERLRTLGLRAACDVPEVMEIAEPLLSPALKAGVGNAMYDANPPATYDEWRADLLRSIQVIDHEE
jgi:hypothetical protein